MKSFTKWKLVRVRLLKLVIGARVSFCNTATVQHSSATHSQTTKEVIMGFEINVQIAYIMYNALWQKLCFDTLYDEPERCSSFLLPSPFFPELLLTYFQLTKSCPQPRWENHFSWLSNNACRVTLTYL